MQNTAHSVPECGFEVLKTYQAIHPTYIEHQKTDTRLFPLSQPRVYESWDVINFVLCPLYLYFICGCGTCREPIYWVTGCRHSVPADNGSPNQFYFFMTNLDKCKAKKYQISNIFMLEAFTKTSQSPYFPLNRAGCMVLSFTQKSFSEGNALQTNEDYYLRRIDNNKTQSSQFLAQILVRPRRSGTMSKLRRSIIFPSVQFLHRLAAQYSARAECSFPWVRMEKFAGWRLHLFLQCSGFLIDPYKHKLQHESLQVPPPQTRTGDWWVQGECDHMTEDAAACHLLVIPLTQPWKTLDPKLWSRWSEARDQAAGDRQVATVYICT